MDSYLKKKIFDYVSINEDKLSIFSTRNANNILPNKNSKKLDFIFNNENVNNIRRINKFHKKVNESLNVESIYLSCGETIIQRENRIKKKIIFGFKHAFVLLDFIYKRVMPKLPITKQIYFSITRGHNRVLSKAEMLGRLSSCGFTILEYFNYKNRLYVISKKNEIIKPYLKPSYGPLISLNRIGFKGKIFKIYKFRTMHPYSEFIQEDVHKENKLNTKGKLSKDFRLTSWGKFLRKYWIDELPQIYNLLRGDIKLVGPRALSEHYFSLYPKDIQDLRISIKPGLIPPYYADMPNSFEEIIESERKFLQQKIKSPIITSIKYFFLSMVNILLKGARSS